ncbi:hypothetical protein T12_9801 [Trichinella patagoniensis]|uniref:Uncharacterized protein n=1 Tax=Trichinella patagoniensis TaxID=990121 RepID=A0A0V0ZYQ7_9BILA|nr:hypothetical protein T12_9801 [Trichinella patagoniensis]
MKELVVKYELMCKDPFCTRENFGQPSGLHTSKNCRCCNRSPHNFHADWLSFSLNHHYHYHFPGWHSIIARAASSPKPPTPLISLNFLVHEQWIVSNPHIRPNSANFKRTGSGVYVTTALVSSLTSPEALSNHIIPYSACCKQMYRLSNPGRKQKRAGCVIYGLMC